jgi:hypothetical protein
VHALHGDAAATVEHGIRDADEFGEIYIVLAKQLGDGQAFQAATGRLDNSDGADRLLASGR